MVSIRAQIMDLHRHINLNTKNQISKSKKLAEQENLTLEEWAGDKTLNLNHPNNKQQTQQVNNLVHQNNQVCFKDSIQKKTERRGLMMIVMKTISQNRK